MNRTISIVLLVVGVILIVMGLNASDSFSSEVSEMFTGNPTDKAIWMLIGGVVLALFGGLRAIRA